MSCESCFQWYCKKSPHCLTRHLNSWMKWFLFAGTLDMVFWNSILLQSVVIILFLFSIQKSYSKYDILFWLINNCNGLLLFISLGCLFLDLGPVITWNRKVKQWNFRRLFIIFNLEPGASSLRHILKFIFSFSFLSSPFAISKPWFCNKLLYSVIFNVTQLHPLNRIK